MAKPPDETAWERAKRETRRVWRSPEFGVGLIVVGLVAAGVAVLFTVEADTAQEQIAIPIVSGLLALAVVFLGTFAVQLAVAPYKQRNEFRREWPTDPGVRPPNVELALMEYERAGKSLADEVEKGWTAADKRAIEAWTQEVVEFLSAHLQDEAADFISASAGEPSPPGKIGAHLAALRTIIDRLDSRAPVAAIAGSRGSTLS